MTMILGVIFPQYQVGTTPGVKLPYSSDNCVVVSHI